MLRKSIVPFSPEATGSLFVITQSDSNATFQRLEGGKVICLLTIESDLGRPLVRRLRSRRLSSAWMRKMLIALVLKHCVGELHRAFLPGSSENFSLGSRFLMDLCPLKLLESGEPANSSSVSWLSETGANYIRLISCFLKC